MENKTLSIQAETDGGANNVMLIWKLQFFPIQVRVTAVNTKNDISCQCALLSPTPTGLFGAYI
jgi:hypothetical protein